MYEWDLAEACQGLIGRQRVRIAGKNCWLVELFGAVESYAIGRRLIESRVGASNLKDLVKELASDKTDDGVNLCWKKLQRLRW
jgi:hypothetical protein